MSDDDDAKAILKRRARYIAMALAGFSSATQSTACMCLGPGNTDAGDPTVDASIDAERPSTRIDVGNPASDSAMPDSAMPDVATSDADDASPVDARRVDEDVTTIDEDAP